MMCHCIIALSHFGMHMGYFKQMVASNMRKMADSERLAQAQNIIRALALHLIRSIVSNAFAIEQRILRLYCEHAQTDLGQHCPYMPNVTFSHVMAHIYTMV